MSQYAVRERTEDLPARHRRRAETVGLLEMLRGDDRRQQPGRGRVEEAGSGASEGGERREHPDVGDPGDEQRRHRSLTRQAHKIGAHHDRSPRRAIRNDPANQKRGEERQRAAR